MAIALDEYRLEDRYERANGQVFLTGTQALTRLPLLQRSLDQARGLNTAGFIAGYRGSPLGGYDQSLWQARQYLKDNHIHFLPAVNEDLAATACLGTQQVESEGRQTVDGVFAIWYGKGPGVDRSGDALRHGNMYGSSPHGGVLAIAGDDHGCVSSSFSHQSDEAFIAFGMPVLHPASISEYLEFGIYGWALSRFSGCWVGFKAISETVEGASTVRLPGDQDFQIPTDFEPPEGGLHNRWPDFPGGHIERRLEQKLRAVAAFAGLNRIDRTVLKPDAARFGIVTTGKAHLDLMDALDAIGIDEEKARELGIAIYKVGLVWPLEEQGIRRFAKGLDEILVVEEKHGVIEKQIRDRLYNWPADERPRVFGKFDDHGRPLVPGYEELRPHKIVEPLALRLKEVCGIDAIERAKRISALPNDVMSPDWVHRTPYFCAGCPHNTSTKVPEGSKAFAGIGCHFMAAWMDRETTHLTQMGGEGVNWVGQSPFTETPHVFQNLGDGTYFHSGSMAIRQAIAAGANITFKILFNDAVAMTGGQPVDGPISVNAVVAQLKAEGVARVEVITDDKDELAKHADLPAGTHLHHREETDAVQRQLREVKGVTAIVYVQTCAAEKRRRRKRGTYPDEAKRIFINEAVCEGCGDCSKQSNCVAIVPKKTAFGTKRQIDQYSCNKDYSCVKGFCPSFVEVTGGEFKKETAGPDKALLSSDLEGLPDPELPEIGKRYQFLVTGVGGTGVITVGALVTMAAHLEGKGASVLDFTGFAQKGGSVMSHVKITPEGAAHPVRIDRGAADALIACDTVVATNHEMLGTIKPGHTRIVANLAELATGEFTLHRDAKVRADLLAQKLKQAAGADRVNIVDAMELAVKLCGDAIATNVLLLGYAWQAGLVPISFDALMRAIELNGVAIDANKRAFAIGRLACVDYPALEKHLDHKEPDLPDTLDDIVAHRSEFLTGYQNARYARRYRRFIERVEKAEAALGGDDRPLTIAVARNLAKLMAYKDEYEVARLYAVSDFQNRVKERFSGDTKVSLYLAPPILNFGRDDQGRPKKRKFGPWVFRLFKLMAAFKGLRGTPFDPFGYAAERRMERALIKDYRAMIETILDRVSRDNLEQAVAIASLPDEVRGFGPVKEAAVREFHDQGKRRLDEFGRTGRAEAA